MNGKLLCLVRGGEAARNVQECAIKYARLHQKTIIFVHIIDAEALVKENLALLEPAREELTWLGEVVLSNARRRAEHAGITVETEILYGNLFEAVKNYLDDNPVELVMVGSPHAKVDNFQARLQAVYQFAEKLSTSIQVPVEVATDC